MRILLATVGTVLLSTASFAAPIFLTDTFSVGSAQAQNGNLGSPITVAASQNNTPIAGYSRTVFVKKLGIPGSDPSNVGGLVNLGVFKVSTDSDVNGISGAYYEPTSAQDLTGAAEAFAIDWVKADLAGGSLTFFVTSSTGGTVTARITDVLNSASTAWYTQPTNVAPTHTYAATLAQILSNQNGFNIGAVTGFGFYHTTALDQDSQYDNFAVSTPEPGTYALMGAGLAALAFLRRRK
ncbi:PEP-CTERM sorting domain-containing protein [Paludibaculum fermentans]|uniref:PEP-CTERM sorting domain-containing protein n=1 Tax=Paludibaculum fermentans TaxID=1473598 RepID=A0A7S7NTZ1_PALFE|nr:PEP-CTERM sorting domain-containing protein [Paludibaculum fermentans]QOY89780.1 PEP-CTERM sorting domain-containing protein [Paludibaculum fermentans]